MDLLKVSTPQVEAIGTILGSFFGLGIFTAAFQIGSYIYIIVWSLDRWGLFDIGLDDHLIFLEWIRWPI